MKKTTRLVLILASALATKAPAQQFEYGYLIETADVVSPSNPTAIVEVWAWFDDPASQYAFAGGNFDIMAGDGRFSDPQLHLPLPGAGNPGGNTPGTVSGNTVRGVAVGQLWGGLGLYPSTENPILLWSADWTTTDFSPRSVALNTLNTTDFWIGLIRTGEATQLYPHGFTHGTGAISVVPTPATALPLALLGTLALGRRRTT